MSQEIKTLISQLEPIYNIGISMGNDKKLQEVNKLVIINSKIFICYLTGDYLDENADELKLAADMNKKIMLLKETSLNIEKIGFLNFCLNSVKLLEFKNECFNAKFLDLLKVDLAVLLNQEVFKTK